MDLRSVHQLAAATGLSDDQVLAALRRLKGAWLVEDDLSAHALRRRGWLRTHRGDVALEHQP